MKLLIALGAVFISSSAFAVSFDCTKASTYAEKTICSDPLLRKLDDALSKNYKAMLGADLGGPVENLRNDQRKWIANRNKCITRECLVATYRERVDETCDYGVVSGVHPDCVDADDIEASQVTGPNRIQHNPVNEQAAAVPSTSLASVPKAPIFMPDAAPGEVDIPNAVDPAKFDIQGFHLYMTGQEVIDLMKAKYNLKPTYDNSCMRDISQPCLKVGLGNEEASPFYPDNNKLLSFVAVVQPTFMLRVSFTPIYPADPKRLEVATMIKYFPLHLETKADIAAFKQQVNSKYGAPSAGSDFAETVNWCRRGIKGYSYYECDAHLPKMTLDTMHDPKLIISDNGGLYWREQKQWETERKAVLPPL